MDGESGLTQAELDAEICAIVCQIERRTGRGVFPWQVRPWLPVNHCESHLREVMRRLAERGKLVRVGGPDARRGYVSPVRPWRNGSPPFRGT